MLSDKHDYVVRLGLLHALSKSSKDIQETIENIIKNYLYDTFLYRFD